MSTLPDGSHKGPVCIGWTTCATQEEARQLAVALVAIQVVACAQVSGPIESYYRWNGKMQIDTEWKLTLKFPASSAAQLERALIQNHPYKVPQWVVVEASHVSEEYRNWVYTA